MSGRLPDNIQVNFPAPSTLFSRIHAALPQTQCTRCGFPDCAAYAQAIAAGEAAINQCPPGGAEGIQRLAAITGLPELSLNPANGKEGPRSIAIIDEAWCIGCTLCINICPTDAIFGSNKMMHTVIEPYCTGCELCVPVCPVDCISLENVSADRMGWSAWSASDAEIALGRYELHSKRRIKIIGQSLKTPENQGEKVEIGLTDQSSPPATNTAAADKKRLVIEAALARARAQQLNKI